MWINSKQVTRIPFKAKKIPEWFRGAGNLPSREPSLYPAAYWETPLGGWLPFVGFMPTRLPRVRRIKDKGNTREWLRQHEELIFYENLHLGVPIAGCIRKYIGTVSAKGAEEPELAYGTISIPRYMDVAGDSLRLDWGVEDNGRRLGERPEPASTYDSIHLTRIPVRIHNVEARWEAVEEGLWHVRAGFFAEGPIDPFLIAEGTTFRDRMSRNEQILFGKGAYTDGLYQQDNFPEEGLVCLASGRLDMPRAIMLGCPERPLRRMITPVDEPGGRHGYLIEYEGYDRWPYRVIIAYPVEISQHRFAEHYAFENARGEGQTRESHHLVFKTFLGQDMGRYVGLLFEMVNGTCEEDAMRILQSSFFPGNSDPIPGTGVWKE